MQSRNRAARGVALCGLFAALSVVLMELGSVIAVLAYTAPMMACILVMVVGAECGVRLAWTEYGAAALLSVLLVPDKESAFLFLFLGYYPLVKHWFDKLRPRLLRLACKLLYFNGSVLAMFLMLYSLFFPGQLLSDLHGAGAILTATTLALGNLAFLLMDRALCRLLAVYRLVVQTRLHKMLGWR